MYIFFIATGVVLTIYLTNKLIEYKRKQRELRIIREIFNLNK